MQFHFGPHIINSSEQIFFASRHSLGLVNLKPIVPGHVLVIPKRICPRLADLDENEAEDFFKSIHLISKRMENYFKAQSMTLTIQDGRFGKHSFITYEVQLGKVFHTHTCILFLDLKVTG
jgi:bis(5'-adenosyl)-triphosphatase